jgi:pyruvate dehydrogenase E1 component alpha subunit
MSKKKSCEGEDGNAPEEFSLISRETLLALYRGLLESRLDQGRASRLRGLHSIAKFMAAHVAISRDRRDGDTSHIAIQPANLARLNTEDRQELEKRLGAVVSTSLVQALGSALVNQTRKNGRVTVVWGGNAEDESWLDALETARAHTLPVIFVVDVDRAKVARKRARRVQPKLKPGEELPTITVDGNDVIALYRVAHEAMDRARRGRGPTLIELATFRIGGRRFTNAVADMENYLRGRGLLRPGMRREILREIEAKIARRVAIE